MIKFDSPLRLLPPDLDLEQMLILDGIRHAAEVSTLAYRRLTEGLTILATSTPEAGNQGEADARTAIYLDAWALVDAIDRLRMLVGLLPMSDEDKARHDSTAARLAGIRSIRNVADHLAQRVQYVLANNAPAYGALTWFTLTGLNEGVSCALVPGAIGRKLVVTAVNPAGKAFHPPTDHITMIAGEYRVSLSEAFAVGSEMVAAVEHGVSSLVKEHGLEGKSVGADLTVKLTMSFFEIQSSPAVPIITHPECSDDAEAPHG